MPSAHRNYCEDYFSLAAKQLYVQLAMDRTILKSVSLAQLRNKEWVSIGAVIFMGYRMQRRVPKCHAN